MYLQRKTFFFPLISSSNLLSAGAAFQLRDAKTVFSLHFFVDLKTKKQTKKKEKKKKRCSVFSAGCCQRANQKPPPDGEQNSCRLQINVGCNSTVICPRPQLLTAAPPPPPPPKLPRPPARNPTSDSFSALIPDPRPGRARVCARILTEEKILCGDSFNRRSNKVLFYSLLLLLLVLSSCEV